MTSYSPNIIIRPATIDDVSFVAQCVLASVELCDFREDSVEKDVAEDACGRDDTLYSWRNARIATIEGTPVGCIVSYPGEYYLDARERTFKIFRDAGRPMDDTEREANPGEWYLDSMSIVPAFRGYGIGRLLMSDAIDSAIKNGYRQAALIVEYNKPHLRDYYSGMGFMPEREMNAFGEKYLKMCKTFF